MSVVAYDKLLESSEEDTTLMLIVYTCDLNKNNLIIAQHKVSEIFLIEKSIVYTYDFFNNNSSWKCDIFLQ